VQMTRFCAVEVMSWHRAHAMVGAGIAGTSHLVLGDLFVRRRWPGHSAFDWAGAAAAAG